jgi:hypothetical protein
MNRNTLIFVGLGVLAYVLFKEATNIWGKIEYGYTKLRIKGIKTTPTGIGLEVKVIQPITNKNNLSFPIESIAGTMFYGRRPLATFAMPAPVVVGAGQTTNIEFDGVLDFGQSAETIQTMIQTGQWLQALRFEGVASSTGVAFPFNHTVSIG